MAPITDTAHACRQGQTVVSVGVDSSSPPQSVLDTCRSSSFTDTGPIATAAPLLSSTEAARAAENTRCATVGWCSSWCCCWTGLPLLARHRQVLLLATCGVNGVYALLLCVCTTCCFCRPEIILCGSGAVVVWMCKIYACGRC